MVELDHESWVKFIKRVEEDLKHPVGPVPTPKLEKALELLEKEIERKKITTIVPCKECHEHPCTCIKRYKYDEWDILEDTEYGGWDDRVYVDLDDNLITGILEGFYGYGTLAKSREKNCQYVKKGKRHE